MIESPPKHFFVMNIFSKSSLWHQRLGYINYKKLQIMKKRNYVHGLPSISTDMGLDENCILGKMSRQKFNKDNAIRANQILHLMHSDLMGPFQVKSL